MAGPHIVVQSSIKWDFLWQGHQMRALELAASVPVTFIETTGIRAPGVGKAAERLRRALAGRPRSAMTRHARLPPGLRVLSPLVLPPTAGAYRLVNRELLLPRLARAATQGATGPLVYIAYLPTRSAIDLGRLLRPALTVYHCLLDFTRFPGAPRDIAATEEELARTADLVVVDSRHLGERLSRFQDDVITLLPGVDDAHFARGAAVAPGDSGAADAAPRAAYFGGMGDHRFDWGLVAALAAGGVHVELHGPDPGRSLPRHPLVTYRGEAPYSELPARLAAAEVLVLPYLENEFNRGTFPVKLFQCFATGLPVVATRLPELAAYSDLIELASGPDEFVAAVRSARSRDTEQRAAARRELAAGQSWRVRAAELLAALRERLPS